MTTKQTKKQFLQRKKIASLPRSEQERRWKQYLQSASATDDVSQPRARSNMVPRVHPCIRHYLRALIDPWGTEAGACVPRWPSLASQKLKTFARSTGVIGSSGVGFVAVKPTLANDVDAVFNSSGTYTGISIEATGTGVWGTKLNGPYQASDFTGDLIEGRIVACGLRVRYTGTELNKGGRAIAIEEPDHLSLVGKDAAALLKYDKAITVPFDREWICVTFQPVRSTDLEYAYMPTYYNNPIMGVLFNGVEGNTFEFEYFEHVEYIGSLARGKTPTHADAIGFAKALEVSSQMSTKVVDKLAASPSKLAAYAEKALGYAHMGVDILASASEASQLLAPLAKGMMI